MCVVSMVGEHYTDKYKRTWPDFSQWQGHTWTIGPEVSKKEFDELKKDVLEMKELLKKAKEYDKKNGEPDCEIDDKVALLKKIAKMVGVSLEDIFGKEKA